jgi:hypothetical protein
MTKRPQLHIRLPEEHKQQLARLAAQRRIPMSRVIETAVAAWLTAPPAPDQALLRRLDRLQQRQQVCVEYLEIVAETLALFVRVYLSTTSEVPDTHRAAAARNGGRRYARFVQTLAARLQEGHRLRSDLEADNMLEEETQDDADDAHD